MTTIHGRSIRVHVGMNVTINGCMKGHVTHARRLAMPRWWGLFSVRASTCHQRAHDSPCHRRAFHSGHIGRQSSASPSIRVSNDTGSTERRPVSDKHIVNELANKGDLEGMTRAFQQAYPDIDIHPNPMDTVQTTYSHLTESLGTTSETSSSSLYPSTPPTPAPYTTSPSNIPSFDLILAMSRAYLVHRAYKAGVHFFRAIQQHNQTLPYNPSLLRPYIAMHHYADVYEPLRAIWGWIVYRTIGRPSLRPENQPFIHSCDDPDTLTSEALLEALEQRRVFKQLMVAFADAGDAMYADDVWYYLKDAGAGLTADLIAWRLRAHVNADLAQRRATFQQRVVKNPMSAMEDNVPMDTFIQFAKDMHDENGSPMTPETYNQLIRLLMPCQLSAAMVGTGDNDMMEKARRRVDTLRMLEQHLRDTFGEQLPLPTYIVLASAYMSVGVSDQDVQTLLQEATSASVVSANQGQGNTGEWETMAPEDGNEVRRFDKQKDPAQQHHVVIGKVHARLMKEAVKWERITFFVWMFKDMLEKRMAPSISTWECVDALFHRTLVREIQAKAGKNESIQACIELSRAIEECLARYIPSPIISPAQTNTLEATSSFSLPPVQYTNFMRIQLKYPELQDEAKKVLFHRIIGAGHDTRYPLVSFIRAYTAPNTPAHLLFRFMDGIMMDSRVRIGTYEATTLLKHLFSTKQKTLVNAMRWRCEHEAAYRESHAAHRHASNARASRPPLHLNPDYVATLIRGYYYDLPNRTDLRRVYEEARANKVCLSERTFHLTVLAFARVRDVGGMTSVLHEWYRDTGRAKWSHRSNGSGVPAKLDHAAGVPKGGEVAFVKPPTNDQLRFHLKVLCERANPDQVQRYKDYIREHFSFELEP